jgi:putative FmdB family regulatory protein
VPVYEYRCTKCGERTHRLQDIGEDSSGKRCLSCEKGVIKKVFSVFSTATSRLPDSCSGAAASRFT